jgi:hypothetical protein
MPEILFIFSAPRSGSTAMQHHLASRIDGAMTLPETWIVPFAMAARDPLAFSTVGLVSARLAEQQLFAGAYDEAIFNGIRSFFHSQCEKNHAKVFIEKTPRNIIYASEILDNIPEAKILLVVRHPVDIALSIFEHFCKKRPNLAKSAIDLFQSIDNVEKISKNSRCIVVKYEEFSSKDLTYIDIFIKKIGLDINISEDYSKSTILNSAIMGDNSFSINKYKYNKFNYRYEKDKISLVTYFVLKFLIRRHSWSTIIKDFYGQSEYSVLKILKSNVCKLGFVDLLFFIGGYISSFLNFKSIYFKFKERKYFSYLR